MGDVEEDTSWMMVLVGGGQVEGNPGEGHRDENDDEDDEVDDGDDKCDEDDEDD